VVWRLPSLELLERMSHSSVLVGVISISIGTVLGFIWVDRLTGQYWFYDPKYVITLVCCFFICCTSSSRAPRHGVARALRNCASSIFS
jgi:ABC-type transport system involved in cytochrome c biogenesis permease subunit